MVRFFRQTVDAVAGTFLQELGWYNGADDAKGSGHRRCCADLFFIEGSRADARHLQDAFAGLSSTTMVSCRAAIDAQVNRLIHALDATVTPTRKRSMPTTDLVMMRLQPLLKRELAARRRWTQWFFTLQAVADEGFSVPWVRRRVYVTINFISQQHRGNPNRARFKGGVPRNALGTHDLYSILSPMLPACISASHPYLIDKYAADTATILSEWVSIMIHRPAVPWQIDFHMMFLLIWGGDFMTTCTRCSSIFVKSVQYVSHFRILFFIP